MRHTQISGGGSDGVCIVGIISTVHYVSDNGAGLELVLCGYDRHQLCLCSFCNIPSFTLLDVQVTRSDNLKTSTMANRKRQRERHHGMAAVQMPSRCGHLTRGKPRQRV